MDINFDDILLELRFRVEGGVVDLTNAVQVDTLVEILRENGVDDANTLAQKARGYFILINETGKKKPESVSDTAHKQGLVGKGGTAYGPKSGDKITHINNKGHLEKLDKPIKVGNKSKEQPKIKGTAVFPKEKESDSTKEKETNKKVHKKVARTENETKKQKLNDATFVSIIKNGLIPTQKKQLSGAGVFSMSREQAKMAVDFYTKRLETPDYQLDLPRYEVSEEDIDKAVDIMKKELGKSFTQVWSSIQKAGGVSPDLTKGEAGKQRARDIVKLYLQFGGRSAVTGKIVPFNQMQLDHRIPYSSAPVRVKEKEKKGTKTTLLQEQDILDSPENWDLIETPINQQKKALTGNELVETLAKTANMTDDEFELKQLKQEIQNIYETELQKSLVKSFKNEDYSGMNVPNIKNMSGEEIDIVMKAWNYWHPNTRDADRFRKADTNYDSILKKAGIKIPPPDDPHTIQRGKSQEGGSRSRGEKWPVPIRKKLTIKAMGQAKVLTSAKDVNKTNLVLLKAIEDVKKLSKEKEERAAELAKKIKDTKKTKK
jgi:hypothetical protein